LCWIGSYVSSAEVKKAIDAAQALLSGAPVQQNKPAIAQNSVNTVAAVPEPVEGVETTAAPVQPKSEESLGINPIPNGLPRLSMLDKLIEEEANGGGGEPPDADAESANPFHDGGPLPPEQSVAATQAEISHPAELDERLKLHISQENVSDDGQAMPVMDIPLSASGYSENPDADFGDDGWSNMDAPPDDEYYPDEGELANNAEAAYEEATNPVAASAPVQLQETFVAANGQTISIAQLRGQVTAALAITDGFAASNVEKTGLWVMEADGVSTTVESDYDLSLIEKKKNVIAAEISNICGRPMNLYVTLKVQDKQEAAEKVEIPLQVNILVNAFKGTIVAGRM